ncbi:hypothetical protein [Caenimonas sp. SL110]|uniref:Acg family FMN-binding oxidoreductase n=1 Tax=Caenimonas sp. SL110 TaxID=1450524 RepID=UPI000653FCA5|nr:hypothetical protein [Caenimonas sp. SL110]
MQRRNFLHVVGGVGIAAALPLSGCSLSSQFPAQAVQAWQGPSPQETDVRRWILSYAILAPHSHNLQSWLVDLRTPGEIVLFCDLTRLLPETDPLSRQIMMSQGTFLELLDLAARQRGQRAAIELFPQGEFANDKPDARPVARIRLAADPSIRPDPLFAQIAHRHTNREHYESRLPSADGMQAMTQSLAGHAVRAGFIDSSQPAAMQQHREIAKEAWRIELVTPRTIMESYKVLRVGPEEIAQHRDGLSINTPVIRALTALGLFDRTKAPGPGDSATTGQLKDFNAKIDSTPAFFWMVTEGNDRRTQINAGRAYARAQLAATAQGLVMHPLSQALQEYPEQAATYRQIHELLAAPAPRFTVQMWTRLGYAAPAQPSPRRGLDAHLVAGVATSKASAPRG